MHCGTKQDPMQRFLQGKILIDRSNELIKNVFWKYLCKWNYWTLDMGFKKGIEKCVECERKMSEDPDETGMCSKCGSGARVDSEIQMELNDLWII